MIFLKLIVLRGFDWYLKSMTFKKLSLDKRQYFKFYSLDCYRFDPLWFQQKESKSDLFFFYVFVDFNGDYLISQNLKDYLDNDPNKLFVPNLTTSTGF